MIPAMALTPPALDEYRISVEERPGDHDEEEDAKSERKDASAVTPRCVCARAQDRQVEIGAREEAEGQRRRHPERCLRASPRRGAGRQRKRVGAAGGTGVRLH